MPAHAARPGIFFDWLIELPATSSVPDVRVRILGLSWGYAKYVRLRMTQIVISQNSRRPAPQAVSHEGGQRCGVDHRQLRACSWVAVADIVKGIDPAHIDRIFDPFFTTRNIGSRMGLGLSMVHFFAKRHGGRVAVDYVPRRGAVFTLWLPISAS